MIKGLIFDFDGTLANTLPIIFACYDYSTEKILGKKADRTPFIETFGQPLYICLTSIFGEEKGSKICDEYRAYQEIHHDELILPFPGVKETLEQLYAGGIPMAVVTSKSTATCLRGAKCLGIDQYFTAVIGADAVTHPKPDPQPTLLAVENLGTKPEETLCIGDAPYDVMSGKAAGCHTAAVEYTQFDLKKFKAMVTPEYWLKDMPALLLLLERLNNRERN
ncbi:MAG: HAD-IA family hydrolase [Acidaminococcaceae bacterium]|nr:HAD-IA family hydrolase [Acidaminococcaceae bacterium]